MSEQKLSVGVRGLAERVRSLRELAKRQRYVTGSFTAEEYGIMLAALDPEPAPPEDETDGAREVAAFFDMTGRVAMCGAGRIGRITGRKMLPWGESWVGVGVFDGLPWASRLPRLLCEEDATAITAAAR